MQAVCLPLVSVVLPSYNAEDFIVESVESCVGQEYDNLEIIISDDASTDSTPILLKKLKEKYPDRIRLFLQEENLGISNNCNFILKHCAGTYIAFHAGDDVMLPTKIGRQVEYMENNLSCTICYHNLEVFQSKTNETLYYFNEKRKYQGDIYTCIMYGAFNGGCSNMVRAEKAPKNGYNKTIPAASDWLYWIETLNNGGSIDYIDEVLGRYRRHDNNITSQSDDIGQNKLDCLNSCNIILSLNPKYFNAVMFKYSNELLSLRYILPYFKTTLISMLISPDISKFVRLVVYVITLGRMRL
jgi:glycosyltransferase involved in cell wall biosynthesis